MNKKRLFFSLEGVDINDGDALAAFAQQVWEQATAAFKEEQDNTDESDETEVDRGIEDDE